MAQQSNTASLGFDCSSLHPFVRATVKDKIRGTIVGSALGDCIGLYTEFLSKKLAHDAYPERKFRLVEPATEMKRDRHRDKFDRNAWTDDTDHALLILLSYLHHDGKEVSSRDLSERLRIWVDQGLLCLERPPLGLGRTVRSVVTKNSYLKDPAQAAYNAWVKSNRTIAPNGSLMRTHPLGIICVSFTLEKSFQVAADFSVVTHADPRCVVACCVSTALIRGMLRGELLSEEDVDSILEESYQWVEMWIRSGRGGAEYVEPKDGQLVEGDLLQRDEFEKHAYSKTFEELQLDELEKIGYVYKCLGAAILALRLAIRQAPLDAPVEVEKLPNSVIFENIMTSLTLEAGDADTNACAAGALLGCWLGYNSLPAHWRDGMKHIEWMVNKCDGLACVLGVNQNCTGYRGSEDPDTRQDGGKGLMDKDQLAQRDKEFTAKFLARLAEGAELEKKRLEEEKRRNNKGLSGMLALLTTK